MNTPRISNWVDSFNSLNLENYPVASIKVHIEQMGLTGMSLILLKQGDIVVRARSNGGNQYYSNIAELTYKPSELNNTYQRASTPRNTMFYGCISTNNKFANDRYNLNSCALAETSRIINNKSEETENELVTLSYWRVSEPIGLILIARHQDFLDGNIRIHNADKDAVHLAVNQNELSSSMMVSEFYASAFENSNITGEHNYLIPALFTEYVLEKSLQGVYYPSIHRGYDCFNVAIHPSAVDSCMKCESVIVQLFLNTRELKTTSTIAVGEINHGNGDISYSDAADSKTKLSLLMHAKKNVDIEDEKS